MKLTGEKLRAVLLTQVESVTLVDPCGNERRGISPRYAADSITGGEFIGYARAGVVEKVVAAKAPRRGPFATSRDVAAMMAGFPRLPRVTRNPQNPGAGHWIQQPAHAQTGQIGKITTIHFG